MFRHLSDRDLGRLIAYLRTVPVTAEGETEKTEVRIIGRVLLAKGDFKTAAVGIPLLPAAAVDGEVVGDLVEIDADRTQSHGELLPTEADG